MPDATKTNAAKTNAAKTNAAKLNAKFAVKDHLRFEDTAAELTKIVIATPAVKAEIYTHGAHLTHWEPAGQKPGLFLSGKSEFAPDKAIRGGVPVIFPWFGPRSDGKEGPMHGFARIAEWTVESTHFAPDDSVEVVLSLGPSEFSRSLGFDDFHVTIHFILGATLQMMLDVTNHGKEPLVFEEALHTYFAVGDARQVSIDGLQGTKYLDKRENFAEKTQTAKLLTLTRDVDQVHLNTTATCLIDDPAWARTVDVAKAGSNTTVTWNPWSVLTPGLKDMDEDGWIHFVCVETVNAGVNKVTLKPGSTHRMSCTATIHGKKG